MLHFSFFVFLDMLSETLSMSYAMSMASNILMTCVTTANEDECVNVPAVTQPQHFTQYHNNTLSCAGIA